MNLKDFDWKIRYRSDKHSLLNDFYIPALKRSVLYQRSAGYFSTESLVVAAKGIAYLIEKGGCMQLVVSPNFSESDIKAIEKGYKKKEEVITQVLERDFFISENKIIRNRLEVVSWMIANGLLDIKIAYPIKDNKVSRGIYHEKVGIFVDSSGDYMIFSGSANESMNAYIYNFESFDVQTSWVQGLSKELAGLKKQEFDDLWNHNTSNLEVLSMPKAIKDKILEIRPKNKPAGDPEDSCNQQNNIDPLAKITLALPGYIILRDHQKKALDQWVRQKGCGILEHATGAGKTITALNITVTLYEQAKRLAVIILCPQKHIVDQWAVEARRFGFSPIIGYEKSIDWMGDFNRNIVAFNVKAGSHFMLITTNASFSMAKVQELVSKIKGNLLLIADEVHNLGALRLRKNLIENANFRLGLSATPNRWYDQTGSQTLQEYFGKILEPPYTIADAIR
ncbi:MAG: DEAD/DEAH box helicase family protein, partial [Candidatus Omnitrophica bacterium]|nr:DEAD/DEAH box helicase family protein [Candidatus Omnitrophota bacterium]